MNKEVADQFLDQLIKLSKDDLVKYVQKQFFPFHPLPKREALIVLAKIGKMCNDELKKK